MMTRITETGLAPETIAAILTETLRAELARILVEQDHGPVLADDEIAHAPSFEVEVELGETSEAEHIRVLDGQAKQPVFEFHRSDPVSGDPVGSAALQKAARAFRDFVEGHPLKLPRHPLKRFAIEHFQALA